MADHSLVLPTTPIPLRSPHLWVILASWFTVVFARAHSGSFLTFGRSVPIPLARAAVTPPVNYLMAYRALPSVRPWVISLELARVAGTQTWRAIGVVFFMLWGQGELPSVFALSAGLGDLAVASLH
mgnify:CR=1 FL=1